MTTNTIQTLSLSNLETVTGGGAKLPLSGDVLQHINTNWGGTQTNIAQQVINQAPKVANTITEFLRTNPEARLKKIMGEARKIRRF